MGIPFRFGKSQVVFYRTYPGELSQVTAIPESGFTCRANRLFACAVDVEVLATAPLPSYPAGEQSYAFAPESMKGLILSLAGAFKGATLEEFLLYLGDELLLCYPRIQLLQLSARESPFSAAAIPDGMGAFVSSDVLFSRSYDDYSVVTLQLARDLVLPRVLAHQCGREGLQLIRLGSPSGGDGAERPLFILLDVYWRYADAFDAFGPAKAFYVDPEQVRDLLQVALHESTGLAVGSLVQRLAARLLRRFPQLDEVSFEVQNRAWDSVFVARQDQRVELYCDPLPPSGITALTLSRDELLALA